MRSAARAFLVFVLVLSAIFGGAACSFSGGEISTSDARKLSDANFYSISYADEKKLEVNSCTEYPMPSREGRKCRARVRTEYLAGMRSALTVYERVAQGADGECQKALSKVARDIRGEVAVTTSDLKQMNALDQRVSKPKRLSKDVHAVPGACHFKFPNDDPRYH